MAGIDDLKPHDPQQPGEPIKAPEFDRSRKPGARMVAAAPKPPKVRRPRRKGKIGGDKSAIVAQLPIACMDETAAVEFLERQRWGDAPCCPHCGDTDVRKMLGKDGKTRNRRYLWRCLGCRKQYTVRIGTVYEESRIPLRHWCFAFWASCASKKGVSALQIKRQTGLNYRSALFLLNRIRHAMAPAPNGPKLGGVVEVDEVYIGGVPRKPFIREGDTKTIRRNVEYRKKWSERVPVVACVERGGEVRANPIDGVTAANLRQAIVENVEKGTYIFTDDRRQYRTATIGVGAHRSVNHSAGEYVRGPVHTNSVEGFFSLLRRRIDGTHHAVSKAHLHRYVSEAAFVYSHRGVDDGERVRIAIRAANGKRLFYVEPEAPAA
ncbi:MAG TPA: IS1595 family transposase [Phycisphaerales bacterium]|nr:IS1595 family transposase [Phycisphaerales bacterium]